MLQYNMQYSKEWRDFEIIATGGGEKLERWGGSGEPEGCAGQPLFGKGTTVVRERGNGVYLLRPDPQAIWAPAFDFYGYPGLHAKYTRSSDGGGHWTTLKKFPTEWTVSYKDLKFIISPTNFKHTGLFPEQAVNWDRMADVISKACASVSKACASVSKACASVSKACASVTNNVGGNKEVTVLNLFGYTGGATVACAKAGAIVTHVDASRGMTEVCKRNCKLNDIPQDSVRFIVDDCIKFVEREIRRGKKYDGIIMDPPSFGRGANGEVWKIEQHLDYLVDKCCDLLSNKPLFFLINSYTTGLQPTVIKNVLQRNLAKRKINANLDAYEIGLPTSESIILPAGCSCFAAVNYI